jgi:hypothetical protein
MHDLAHNIGAVPAIGPATLSADNAPAAIDLNGFGSAALLIGVGAGGITFDGTNKIEFKLTHSDDDSTYTAVVQADVTGTTVGTGGIVKSLTSAHASPTVDRVGYLGGKRYLKVLADFSGTHGTGTPIAWSPRGIRQAHR